ncbi:thiamine monophosphate kinase [Advenella kashmirensis W13003]|uniref:Thiamine-monophosphate kinase n=1 Tax=Advenella kashmirensis W13003 TaxID=1424334 RepID=V8QWS8_9BURK|nr:thiamine-phosphate kinase [Advenella kashmirensis]ETF03813.1 thiamine monophosphate kinase [Advenella kashmirensis W13003]
MSGEFDLIRNYFTRPASSIDIGVGDDCAVFAPSAGSSLAISKDLLLEGRHFFSDVDPEALGHKSLAVNLSDLAAMGAAPRGCLLGIALPQYDAAWLEAFSRGFNTLADRYQCPLIGGDTTRSEHDIVISVTVLGEVTPPYLARSRARPEDDIWVSGTLGAADWALNLLLRQKAGETLGERDTQLLAATRSALERPEPQVALGLALRPLAHAMIDISDGLVQDLKHILQASGVAAILYESLMPVNLSLPENEPQQLRQSVLGGGDVYELCFTAPQSARPALLALSASQSVKLTRIGMIHAGQGLRVLDATQQDISALPAGFDHFRRSRQQP